MESDVKSIKTKKVALQERLEEISAGKADVLARAELEAQRKIIRYITSYFYICVHN